MCNCLWSWHSCHCFSIEVLDTAHESVHKHGHVVHNVENEQIGFYDCRLHIVDKLRKHRSI